jgi:hypothetical protein
MSKNHFVLTNMEKILDALTRGLDLNILSRGYGIESRGVMVSYQAQAPVLGLVLPSNSPGVHTLWLPVIPMQVGLLLKPGPQEPWTPYRMAIFGGTPTVERYRGDSRVQVHGPGFSKILLGDDVVDDWEKYLDIMADSVFLNSGRGCINCSGIWASRHTKEIARRRTRRPVWRRLRFREPPEQSGRALNQGWLTPAASTLRLGSDLGWWKRPGAVISGPW